MRTKNSKLPPTFPEQSSFQIHANDDSKPAIALQDADIPQKVRNKLTTCLTLNLHALFLSHLQILGEQI